MNYVITAIIVLIIAVAIHFFVFKDINLIWDIGIPFLIIIVVIPLTMIIDFKVQTDDNEIWSGKITSVEHNEEWDEWIPPKTETITTTDSKGNTTTETITTPGYWEHHDAENYITTSDSGTHFVSKTPDGRRFTDYFVNSNKELAKYYPIGRSTSSVHTYTNKLKASYSIFKHKDINLKDYKDMPEYPTKESNFNTERLIGNFKNKDKIKEKLDQINTKLNDTNNPNNTKKIKSYKQINLIVVNFGDKPEDYGRALQDHWKNGAKNDIVITLSTDKNNKPKWCYVFSWTDSEIIKSEIRDYIMEQKDLNNFDKNLDHISDLIEKKFVRKEFKDFNYINVDLSTASKIVISIVILVLAGFIIFIDKKIFE